MTGASGAIGREIRDILARQPGWRIQTLGRGAGNDIQEDLTTLSAPLADTLSPKEVILHFAAAVPINADDDTESNAQATRAMDEAIVTLARQWDVPCFYVSGCSLYDNDAPGEKDETSPLQDHLSSAYLQAKKDGEALFLSYPKSVILRLSNPVTRNMDSGNVIGTFYRRAKTGQPITLWGTGARQQDFIDSRDIAHAVKLLIENKAAGLYNVAGGHSTTMAELAALFERLYGAAVTFSPQNDPQERHTARFSTAKLEQETGWKPAYRLETSLPYYIGLYEDER